MLAPAAPGEPLKKRTDDLPNRQRWLHIIGLPGLSSRDGAAGPFEREHALNDMTGVHNFIPQQRSLFS